MWLNYLISAFAVIISLFSLFWNVIVERKKSKAKLEIWQRNHFYLGGDDERTEIELLFRNLSHRPTAIIDIYIRDNESIIGGSGYNNKIKLPIEVRPWSLIQVSFRIEKPDESRMVNILVRDIEDNEIVVIRSSENKWIKAK